MTWHQHLTEIKDIEIHPQELNQEWSEKKLYKTIGNSQDSHFGNVVILEGLDDPSEKVLQLEIMVNSESEARRVLFKCKLRSVLNIQQIQNLIGFECITKKSLCSKHYIIHLFFEKLDQDLVQIQKEKNISNNQQFSSEELKSIKDSILTGLQLLHKHDLVHGNIRPSFIGYSQQDQRFCLLDSYKVALQFERQQFENLQNKDLGIYMSPSLYKKIVTNDQDLAYDKKKNDIFALGLMLLELGTQTKMTQFYLENGEVNENFLSNQIYVLERRCSSYQLVNSIKKMLETKDEDRLTCDSLLSDNLQVNEHIKQLSGVKVVKYNKENVQIKEVWSENKTQDYEVTFETDEHGRKVEIRKYRPGKYPQQIQTNGQINYPKMTESIQQGADFFDNNRFTNYEVRK